MEQIAAEAGYHEIFISVNPVDNPRAFALYQRLGYRALQTEPYWDHWDFTDSAGVVHSGDEWIVDMVKKTGD